jgi:hypothetical protein
LAAASSIFCPAAAAAWSIFWPVVSAGPLTSSFFWQAASPAINTLAASIESRVLLEFMISPFVKLYEKDVCHQAGNEPSLRIAIIDTTIFPSD